MSRWFGHPVLPSSGLALFLLILALSATGFAGTAAAADPRGVWLVDGKAAVEIYDCGGGLCGRIVALTEPRDRQGAPKHDSHNPDPALRDRPLCGLTVLNGLRSAGAGAWDGGRFYNPDDGHRYSATAQMASEDRLVARFFVGLPMLGESRTLTRIGGPLQARALPCAGGSQTASAASGAVP